MKIKRVHPAVFHFSKLSYFVIFRFSNQPVQQLSGHGARAVDITDINGVRIMAIANGGDFGDIHNPAM